MKRTQPQCSMPAVIDIERSIAGACLQPNEARRVVEMDVTPEMFYDIRYSKIFAACCALLADKINPDIVTVAQYLNLNSIDLAEKNGNEQFLAETFASVSTTVNMRDWVTMLREFHGRRVIIRAAYNGISELGDTEIPALVGFRNFSGSINQAEDFFIRSRSLPTAAQGDIYLQSLSQIQQQSARGDGVIIPWGIPGVDRLCPFQRQQIFVLGAGVNTGKTRFILADLAGKLAMQNPPPVVIFSRENSNRVLWDGLVSIVSGIPGHKLNRPGGLTQEENEQVQKTVRYLQSKADFFRLYGKGEYKPTPAGIATKVRHVWNFTKGRLALVNIDYIQNHRPDGKAFGRVEEIDRFMGELTDEMAEFPVGLLLLSQLNRDKERGNRACQVADLKGSSAIEQEADYIAFLQGNGKEKDFYAVKTRSGSSRWKEVLEFDPATGNFLGVCNQFRADYQPKSNQDKD